MKYSIDRIENGIAILENLETGIKKEVTLELLPENVIEGNVIIEKETYELDLISEQERRNSLKSRFDNLKKN